MLWLRTVRLGVKSLLLHPLRSFLTVLGILIGVASVIALVAIGQGISVSARKQIEGLGADNIIVRSIKPPSEKTAGASGPVPYGLTRFELERIAETVPNIRSVLPIREIRRQFKYRDKQIDGRLVGCTPEYATVTHLEVESGRGRFISYTDQRHRKNHCVLAAEVAEELFRYEDPIGRSVFLPEHSDYYVVVGVLKPRGATAAIGGSLEAQDFSRDIYIPIETLRQRIGDTVVRRGSGSFEADVVELNQITIRVNGIDNVEPTAELVEATLTGHEELEDIAIVVPKQLLQQAEHMRIMFNIFFGLIAAISLFVGGIGIMNIMLATVTERTREIGIRRALGARRADIIRQFLVETIALSVVGGGVGVFCGMMLPGSFSVVRGLMEEREFWTSLPEVVRQVQPEIVWMSIPIAFIISVLVGVLFGVYPAIRAAQMDPIEALRHE